LPRKSRYSSIEIKSTSLVVVFFILLNINVGVNVVSGSLLDSLYFNDKSVAPVIEIRDDVIKISNSYIELWISRDHSFRVIKLFNKITGYDYHLENNTQPLIIINGFIETEDIGRRWVSYTPENFKNRTYFIKELNNTVFLYIVLSGLDDWPIGFIDLTIKLGIWVNGWEPRIYFNLSIIDNSGGFYVVTVDYPVLSGFRYFGFDPEYDRFVKEELHLFRPYQTYLNMPQEYKQFGIQWASPPGPGAIGIPYFAFYNAKDGSGLYYLVDDDEGTYKYFIINFVDDVFTLRTINYIPLIPTQKYDVPYVMIIGTYRGFDWYDAAEIYRKHAENKWWTQEKLIDKLGQFPEIHLIFRSTSYFNHSLYNIGDKNLTKVVSYKELASVSPFLSKLFTGVNKAVAWLGWEYWGVVVSWPKLFPPVEGYHQLIKTISDFHTYNISVLPNVGTASYVTTSISDYKSLLDAAVYDIEGNTIGFGWTPNNWNIFMDIRHPLWQNYIINISRQIKNVSFDMVSFDGTLYLNINYKNTSYYKSGDPRGFINSAIHLLSQIKKVTGLPISLEARTEYLIPFYDLAGAPMLTERNLAEMFGLNAEMIPFFQYVYHEYIQFNEDFVAYGSVPAFLYQDAPLLVYFSQDHYYFKYYLSKGAIYYGTIVSVGDFFEGISSNDLLRLPEWQTDFIYRLALARATYARDFLIFGRMTKPVNITSKIPRLRILDVVGQEDVYPYTGLPNLPNFTLPGLVMGGWIAPDGSIGYVFANIADDPIELNVSLARYFDYETIYLVIDGVQRVIYDGYSPPESLELELPASGIGVLVISEGNSDRAIGAKLIGNGIVDLYSIISRLRGAGMNFSDLNSLAEKIKLSYLEHDWLQVSKYSKHAYNQIVYRLKRLSDFRQLNLTNNLSLWNYIDLIKPHVFFDQYYSDLTIDWFKAKEKFPNAPLLTFVGRLYHLLKANQYNISTLTKDGISSRALEGCDLLIITNPSNMTLSISKAKTILSYLGKGGALFMQVDMASVADHNPGIIYLFDKFGLKVYDDIIINDVVPSPYGIYGFDVNITGKCLFRNVFKFHVAYAPRVEIFGDAEVIGWSPDYTYSGRGHEGPFPILISLKYGKGKVFIIFAGVAIQTYDYSNQPLIHAAIKWLLDRSDRAFINVSISGFRVDVGSIQNITVEVISEWSGLPLTNHIVYLNNLSSRTDANGVAKFNISNNYVGKYEYEIEVYDAEGLRYRIFYNDSFSIVWDRVIINLEASDNRIDVGSHANISITAYYEYDETPFQGKILLNLPLVQNEVGEYNYTVAEIIDEKYGLSVFRTNSVLVIFDRVIITLNKSLDRIQVGKEAPISWTAYYEHDGTHFEGTVILNNPLTMSGIGSVTYTVISINDSKYGIKTFVSNEVTIVFDEIDYLVKFDESIFSFTIEVSAWFKSDNKTVSCENIHINNLEKVDGCLYKGVTLFPKVIYEGYIFVSGFDTINLKIEKMLVINLILLIIISIITIVIAYFTLRKR